MNDRLEKAHSFAKAAHIDQKRKFTGEPYLSHLEETAQILWQFSKGTATIDEYVAALLHDSVEDTDVTLLELGQNFGGNVMNLVEEVTINQKQKEEEGKKRYLARRLNEMSEKALNVKLSDRISNVSGLEDRRIPDNFVKWYLKETVYIMENLDRELTELHETLLEKLKVTIILVRVSRDL